MQRETKIGLLVGTGVIVLIGILLSDHLSSSHRQGQAELGQTSPPELSVNVSPPPIEMNENSVAVAIEGAERSESWTGPTRLPNDVRAATAEPEPVDSSANMNRYEPDVLVLGGEPRETRYEGGYSNYRELEIDDSPGGAVAIGPRLTPDLLNGEEESDGLVSWPPPGFIELASEPYGSARTVSQVANQRQAAPLGQVAMNTERPSTVGSTPERVRSNTTVSGGTSGLTSVGNDSRANRTTASASAPANRVTHHVEKGETLSDISTKYYGTVKKINLIVEANRDKIPDPDRIRSGVRLVIPDVPADAVAGAGTATGSSAGSSANTGTTTRATDAKPTKPADQTAVRGGATTAPASTTTYKVKSGDSLAKIAERFYGSQTAWPKLHALNKKTLPDPDRLKEGMTLIVPAKQG